jgi:glycosyltransferase involved in cell wall biosynthesis
MTPILQFINVLNFGGGEGQFIERIRTLDRNRWRPLVATLKRFGPHVKALEEMGLPPREIPLAGSLAHPATAIAIGKLARWMREEKVKLVHAQDFYTNLISIPAARLAGAKVIVSRLDLSHHHDAKQRKALAFASRLADCVHANADAIRRQVIQEDGVAPEKVEVVRNGIDLARMDQGRDQDPHLPVPEGATVIAVVANLHPVKRQEDVVEALAILKDVHPGAHLVLVGEGERRGPVVDLATRHGIRDRVHLLGHRLDVSAILARAHILVSASDAEGLSNAIVEGMAARLPVVATAVGGSPELVEDGVRGLLVPRRDPPAMARALDTLLRDPTLRRRMGHDGRAFVETSLGGERMAREFDRMYQRVLAS